MNFGLRQIIPPSGISDAKFVPNIKEDNDMLVVCAGNQLILYPIEDTIIGEGISYQLFGEIRTVIPFKHSYSEEMSLLVLLKDYRSCVLKFEDDHLVTIQSAFLTPSSDTPVPKDMKYALHPTALVLQLSTHNIDIFPISSSGMFEAPFPIQIGCKEILDFAFVGPTSKVTRLAILTSEYPQEGTSNCIVRLIEIDTSNKNYTEDPANNIKLPDDTTNIISLMPDDNAIIVAFTSQRAIRILYNIGLTPETTTATIFTPNPLSILAPLTPTLYITIDSKQIMYYSVIKEEGTIRFSKIGTCPDEPTSIIPINQDTFFVTSSKDDSIFYNFQKEPNSSEATAQQFDKLNSTGSVLDFENIDDDTMALFSRAVGTISEVVSFKTSVKLESPPCDRIYTFEANDLRYFLLSGNSTYVLKLTDEGEYVKDESFSFNSEEHTLCFAQLSEDTFIQVTSESIIYIKGENNQTVDFKNEIITAAYSNGRLIVATANNEIKLYTFGDEIEEYKTLKSAETITALAINDKEFAVASDSVLIYDINTLKVLNTLQYCSTADMIYYKGTLIMSQFSDWVITCTNNLIKEFECTGSHYTINATPLCAIISGDKPYAFIDNKLYPINVDRFLDCVYADDQVVSVDTANVIFSTVSPPALSTVFKASPNPITAIYKYEDQYITARQTSNGTIVLYSSTNRIELTSEAPFYALNNDEKVLYMVTFDSELYVYTQKRTIRFHIESNSSIPAYVAELEKQATDIGIFQGNYIYYVCDQEVEFMAPDLVDLDNCIMKRFFSITNQQGNVHAVGCNDSVFVCASNNIVSAYIYDDSKETFQFLSRHQLIEPVSKLTVFDNTIICATVSGNIYNLGLTPNREMYPQELHEQEVFALEEEITAIKIINGMIFIGTAKGMVMIMNKIDKSHKFDDFYQVISQNVRSIGNFDKKLQRSPKYEKYIISTKQMYDLDLIEAYKNLSKAEQSDALEHTEYTLETATAILNS